jgi:multidrug efflux pump subunit AcrA (membrane-fusion protein)
MKRPQERRRLQDGRDALISHRAEIQPGMTATLEISTGSQTVLSYLTKPVTKTLSESLGER